MSKNRNQNPAEQNPDTDVQLDETSTESSAQNPNGGNETERSDPPNPPAPPAEQGASGDESKDTKTKETKAVKLKHTTSYKVYRRAGLVLKQQPEVYQVTAEQLAILKKDLWVEVIAE